MTAARWTSGLDLGQATDPAALVCCKQAEGPDPLDARGKCWHYAVRHIHEFHLGTPYTTVGSEIGVAEQVQALFLRPMPGGNPLAGSLLGVDYTGVGRPVFDILRGLAIPCVIVPITSTGGALVHQNGWEFSVPKRALVSNLLKLYQCGRVKVAERLPHREKLERQLAAFRVKQKASGHETFECLVAGTVVETASGPCPIETVRAGNWVFTRAGLRRVRWAGRTKEVRDVFSVRLSSGQVLSGTADHLVWTKVYGWLSLEQLQLHDELLPWSESWPSTTDTRSPKRKSSTVLPTAVRPVLTTTMTAKRGPTTRFTGRSGCITTGKYPTDSTSITRMRTGTTTTFPTSNAFPIPIIGIDTIRRCLLPSTNARRAERITPARDQPRLDHFARIDALAAIARMSIGCASSAVATLPPNIPRYDSAQPFVAKPTATFTAPGLPGSALNAEPCSRPCTRCPSSVRVVAAADIVSNTSPVPVYDLVVEDDHEFFANGVLVHNSERESDHDDILFALALAVWVGETIPVLRRQDVGTGRGREQADAPRGTFLEGRMPEKW